MAQQLYWYELFQLKLHINFLEKHIEDDETYACRIKIFMAMASSASIGAWVVWQDLSFIWALIIAISQVVAAISPHLRFHERLRAYPAMRNELGEVFIQAEAKWDDIASGKQTEAEINEARQALQSQRRKIEMTHLSTTVVASDEDKRAEAEQLAHRYFLKFYPT